jgi:hypothetical protein
MRRSLIPLVVMLLFLSACAIGKKHNLCRTEIVAPSGSVSNITVGVQDTRPYITNMDKTEDFIGLVRNHLGIPYDVKTKSKEPLAQDMATAIGTSLEKANSKVETVDLNIKDNLDGVKSKLAQKPADRFLFLKIDEWKLDTYMNTKLMYDLSLYVFDSQMCQLAEDHLSGSENKGAIMVPSQQEAQDIAAFKEKMELFFSNEKIARALRPAE